VRPWFCHSTVPQSRFCAVKVFHIFYHKKRPPPHSQSTRITMRKEVPKQIVYSSQPKPKGARGKPRRYWLAEGTLSFQPNPKLIYLPVPIGLFNPTVNAYVLDSQYIPKLCCVLDSSHVFISQASFHVFFSQKMYFFRITNQQWGQRRNRAPDIQCYLNLKSKEGKGGPLSTT